jgi:sugar O-acyltransferase (sialic acid O-acetyltransferase NeuD family)
MKKHMKRIAIIGASGHGKVTADAALLSGWDDVAFFDDILPENESVGAWKVKGKSNMLLSDNTSFDEVIVAIGDNAVRLEMQQVLENKGIPIATIIHPASSVSTYTQIGAGSVVFAGAVINAYARVGRCCIVNTGSSIDHDCVVADGVHISPGAHLGGGTYVGKTTWIGIGAVVRQSITIGERVMVGAGAAVVNDIEPGLIVAGIPAREIIKKKYA